MRLLGSALILNIPTVAVLGRMQLSSNFALFRLDGSSHNYRPPTLNNPSNSKKILEPPSWNVP